MCFWDVAFLPPRASFPPHFLQIVVEVKALGPPHVLRLWFGCKQEHAPCSIFLLQLILFLCQLNLMEIIRLSQS